MLHGLIRCSHIYEPCMSPALNGSSALGRFKCSDAIKIRDGISLVPRLSPLRRGRAWERGYDRIRFDSTRDCHMSHSSNQLHIQKASEHTLWGANLSVEHREGRATGHALCHSLVINPCSQGNLLLFQFISMLP